MLAEYGAVNHSYCNNGQYHGLQNLFRFGLSGFIQKLRYGELFDGIYILFWMSVSDRDMEKKVSYSKAIGDRTKSAFLV